MYVYLGSGRKRGLMGGLGWSSTLLDPVSGPSKKRGDMETARNLLNVINELIFGYSKVINGRYL